MHITRRDFIRYAGASAAALGLSRWQIESAAHTLAAAAKPPVIWLSGSGCTGCSVSLLNAVNPTIDHVLLNTISLRYHPNVMAAAGDLAVSAARSTAAAGGYILVVEGAIPTASQGKYCYVGTENGHAVTMAEAVSSLAATAAHVVAVGTCASFGGIPRSNPAAGALGVGAFLNRPVINLPGCPAIPTGSSAAWCSSSPVRRRRSTPTAVPRPSTRRRRSTSAARAARREEADRFGQDGLCLEELGCKGPTTHADCDTRGWNNGQNWCIGANGLCIGCTEPNFPAFPLHEEDDVHDGPPVPTHASAGARTPYPDSTGLLPSVTRSH